MREEKEMYNKSQIMKTAWSLFKSTGKSFSECLHISWVAAKLMGMGGNLWERYGKCRVYLDQGELLDLCGVNISFYKSGNISVCEVGGEKASNSDGRRWLNSTSKVYYDLLDGKIYGQGEFFVDVKKAVKSRVSF